jgi:hypothetical protein
MEDPKKLDSKPIEGEAKPEEKKETLGDMIGGEKSANNINEIKGSEEKPASEKPEEKKPESLEGEKPGEDSTKKDGEDGKGEKLVWDKFKTIDDAKHSYDEAQRKITEQGQELSETNKFLEKLDVVLTENPDIAETLKKALANIGKKAEEKPEAKETEKEVDIDSAVEKAIEKKEALKKTKEELDKWFNDHPDIKENDGKLGHEILDEIETEGYPFTVKTLQTVYDAKTKESAIDKAKKKDLEEIAEADADEGTKVLKGGAGAGKKPKEGTVFGDLVGGSRNVNKI